MTVLTIDRKANTAPATRPGTLASATLKPHGHHDEAPDRGARRHNEAPEARSVARAEAPDAGYGCRWQSDETRGRNQS